MNVKLVVTFVVLVTIFCTSQARRYDNYTLYEVLPWRREQLNFLKNLDTRKYLTVAFWKKPRKVYEEVQFIAAPNETEVLMERLYHYDLPIKVIEQNIQKLFDHQTLQSYQRQRIASFTWEHYHSLEDIYQWLHDISLQYSSLVELKSIGKSAEDRDIFAVKIRRNRAVKKERVIIEAGIHGHEWISPMFATYIIKQLVHVHQAEDDRIRELADAYDWYIVPVVNPDGLAYNHKTDRMWRKNRRATERNHTGVDLNKNFDYSFGLHDADMNPADDCYCGPSPFSEPESVALANFIKKNGRDLNFFFSIHSYGQMIILPYSDSIKRLDNYYEIENYAKQAIMKMNRLNRSKYSVGTHYDMLGTRSSGDSISWVKKNFQPKFVAAFLLQDRGRQGFALAPEAILPACKEGLLGIVEMMTAGPGFMRTNMYRDNSVSRSEVASLFITVMPTVLLWFVVRE